jgi:hypothetical protein
MVVEINFEETERFILNNVIKDKQKIGEYLIDSFRGLTQDTTTKKLWVLKYKKSIILYYYNIYEEFQQYIEWVSYNERTNSLYKSGQRLKDFIDYIPYISFNITIKLKMINYFMKLEEK